MESLKSSDIWTTPFIVPSGRFVEVVLNPKVKISNPDKTDLALELHTKANQLCFIANSCNFPVLHEASCEI